MAGEELSPVPAANARWFAAFFAADVGIRKGESRLGVAGST
jgi:hypothetical protein